MTSISGIRVYNQRTLIHTLVSYLTGLVGFDVGSSDQKRNFDVKLVELPLVQWEGELAWREKRTWVGEENLEKFLQEILCQQNLQKNLLPPLPPTCMVAIVRREEDVGVVQMALRLQRIYNLLHQIVH